MTDNLEPTAGVAQLAHEARSSIELDRDAKGVYRWSIKLYFEGDSSWGTEDVVLSRLRRIDADLRTIFLPGETL